ncbi:MAG: acyl carrier protein [Crocinitomicaceae bacterium]|jgi:acyl carrier protein
MQSISFSEFDEMIKRLFESQSSVDTSSVESWSSMQSLIAVSAIDEHYDVLISHEELKRAKSLTDLHGILITKVS